MTLNSLSLSRHHLCFTYIFLLFPTRTYDSLAARHLASVLPPSTTMISFFHSFSLSPSFHPCFASISTCVYACARVCVCARDRESQTDRDRQKERERWSPKVAICVFLNCSHLHYFLTVEPFTEPVSHCFAYTDRSLISKFPHLCCFEAAI